MLISGPGCITPFKILDEIADYSGSASFVSMSSAIAGNSSKQGGASAGLLDVVGSMYNGILPITTGILTSSSLLEICEYTKISSSYLLDTSVKHTWYISGDPVMLHNLHMHTQYKEYNAIF